MEVVRAVVARSIRCFPFPLFFPHNHKLVEIFELLRHIPFASRISLFREAHCCWIAKAPWDRMWHNENRNAYGNLRVAEED